MNLKILIDHNKLVDSPFDESRNSFFNTTKVETQDFLQELINGKPTCYLISGYRGAGKSSFIKRLELEIKNEEKKKGTQKTVFVHLNFAKYEEKSILLRKLIRTFHLKCADTEVFQKLNKKTEKNLKLSLTRFEELFERTFYSVSKNTNEKKSTSESSSIEFKANLRDVLLILVMLAVSVSIVLGLNIDKWYSFVLSTIPILGLWKYFQIQEKTMKEKSSSSETTKSMLYDDEIAEHYLIEVLKSLENHVRPVFVLDEMDKINSNAHVESIINELKPIMLSGLASFIVVAGQNLYYNYFRSQSRDDDPLSSIFSRVHHVGLLSPAQIRAMFKELNIGTPSNVNEQELIDSYANQLIIESRCIPRRLIILIRQRIEWANNQAFLSVDDSVDRSKFSKALDAIGRVREQEISRHSPAIRDYFLMQLYLVTNKILFSGSNTFERNDILS